MKRCAGVTLIEVLVAALLLILSVIAIAQMWKLSRHLTENSRNWAEYYAVARQEVERDKEPQSRTIAGTQFQGQFVYLFNSPGPPSNPLWTDYTQNGVVLATNLASGAAATAGAYYRAKSVYTLVTTGSETEATRKLGIQQISVYQINGTTVGTTPVYQTTIFYTAPGV